MFRFFFSLFLFVCISTVSLSAQQLPSNIDFSTVNVDNLSDDQLTQLLQKAQQNGLSVDDVVQQAQAKGMPSDQASKLKDRLNALSSGVQSQSTSTTTSATQENYTRKYGYKPSSKEDSLRAIQNQKDDSYRKRIFGAELFSNTNLTFEPNLNIPTPGNYVVGAGDELIVDVFGYSEKNEHLKVTPEGYINLSNVGPVLVSGLTIDEAKARIIHKLTSIYSGIANGSTHVQVLLGNIRSIQVMVIGQVMRPGSYTLPSLATVANALYVSGGPDINGSFRNIDVVRDGKKIVTFDLYDFLEHGSLSKNVLLKDQDIIKINAYTTRVELTGEIKHPAIFEVADGESLKDIIDFAGGFTSNAYKAFIRADRNNNKEKEIITVPEDSTAIFKLKSGDVFFVDSILNRFTNRVIISGSVFHPGDYALLQNMTVKDLIEKADGLREDAFMQRGLIKRLKADYSPEIVSFDVKEVLSGASSVPLQKEDSVIIYSKFKIREPYYIVIRGEINGMDSVKHSSDTIVYAENMHLGDAILLAGGLRDAASLDQIEVGRRVRSQQYNPRDTALAIVKRFSIKSDLSESAEADSFKLEPFDEIMVRYAPGYHAQEIVKVEGQVVYPGSYVVDAKSERLSDLIRKAGGLKPEAFSEGALLLREVKKEGSENYFERNKLDVFTAANKGNDSLEVRKIKQKMDSSLQLVGINLEKAISSPRSKFDLLLERGDVIQIPKKLETVSLYGEVFYPKQVRFDKRYRFKDFINQGGGFTSDALRRKSYIVYPNGEVASTSKVLFFNHFPRVKPGSEIFVPAKKERAGLSTQEVVGLTSGLAALLAIIYAITKG